MGNLFCHVPRGNQAMVAAALRTIFAQPNQDAARRQLRAVYEALLPRWPQAAQVLSDAEEDVLASMVFPQEPWKRIYSNNLLERLNKEVKRRANVEGSSPMNRWSWLNRPMNGISPNAISAWNRCANWINRNPW